MSNLFKAGWIQLNEDTRVIDSNELVERRLREAEESMFALQQSENMSGEEAFYQDGFSEGLNAEDLTDLLDTDSESAILKNAAQEEVQMLQQQAMEAREELDALRTQAEGILEEANAKAQAMANQIREEAQNEGFQKGYADGMAEAEALKQEIQLEKQRLETEYEQMVLQLEPEFINAITDIYEKVFQVDLSAQKDLVSHLLIDAMLKIEGARNAIVHVSREDYENVCANKETILTETGQTSDRVEFVQDATLAKAQCLIETDNGVYDCSLDTELSELKRKLELLSYGKRNN